MSGTVSTSGSYSIGGNTYKGMAGLASGVDTASMVEQMLSGTQSKIDKANGEKQQVTWKQEIYRDIISKINSFQSKFFSLSSGASNLNMMTSAFFNSMSAISSSSAVKVTANSSAAKGNTSIEVSQLATSTTRSSAATVSKALSGDVDLSAFDSELDLKVNGTKIHVDLSAALAQSAADIAAGTTTKNDVIVNAINSASSAAGASLTASVDDKGKLMLDGGKGSDVMVLGSSSSLGLSMTGLIANTKSGDSGKIAASSEMNPDSKVTVDVSLNGVKKTITLDPTKKTDTRDPLGLNTAFKRAFGAGQITVNATYDSSGNVSNISFAAKDKGQQITFTGSSTGLDALGMVAGQSDKIGLGLKLKDVAFATGLQGQEYKFKINDVEFSFTGEDTVSSVISKINNSDANVKLTYNDATDKFIIQSATTGAGYSVDMTQESGNLLNAMFGNDVDTISGKSVSSTQLVTKNIATSSVSGAPTSVKSGTFKIKVNGADFTITLAEDEKGATYSAATAMKAINEKLAQRYGYTDDGEANIEITSNGLEVRNGAAVSFDSADKDSSGKVAETDVNALLGLVDSNNNATASTNLQDVVGFDSTSTGTVQDLIDNANATGSSVTYALDSATGRITATAASATPPNGVSFTPTGDLAKIFGSDQIDLGTAGNAVADIVNGDNAKITIDGVQTERSSNIFTVNGLQIELMDVTTAGSPAKITTTRDTDKILDGIKTFVEDYNKLISDLNSVIDEEATYRKYDPLTSEQKKEMSESEIKLWEEKAKTGLLRNDSGVSSFLASMRTAMYTKPTGSSFSIFDIGIETSSDWRDKGKLVIKDESKLKQILESDPQDIEALFNGTDGIFKQLNESINKTAKTSSGAPGTLVQLAGVVGRGTEHTNTLSLRLNELDSKLKDLNTKYQKERTRYWNQFSAMEKAISNLNTQSSWLTQQMGG